MSADPIARLASTTLAAILFVAGSGCALWPDRVVEPQFHNPFPQLHRVAVLPFYNQSAEPTVDGEEVAIAYYNELQAIPGFEVMPVGVAKQTLAASIAATGSGPRTGMDFQKLAQLLGVDAVIVGSITEYSPYYPPRMGLSVDWYAANPGFHPIPPGYGLPWGRAEEEFIPSTLVREAEFALAREQLKTQAPEPPSNQPQGGVAPTAQSSPSLNPEPEAPPDATAQSSPSAELLPPPKSESAPPSGPPVPRADGDDAAPGDAAGSDRAAHPSPSLPPFWPDPRGFIPPPPSLHPPVLRQQHAPLMSHTRIYHGQDAKFTERLATYYFFRDDARFGGWTGYLQRPEDFIRFCCHLHVTETLAARGGAGEARVLWRWPISRYER